MGGSEKNGTLLEQPKVLTAKCSSGFSEIYLVSASIIQLQPNPKREFSAYLLFLVIISLASKQVDSIFEFTQSEIEKEYKQLVSEFAFLSKSDFSQTIKATFGGSSDQTKIINNRWLGLMFSKSESGVNSTIEQTNNELAAAETATPKQKRKSRITHSIRLGNKNNHLCLEGLAVEDIAFIRK